GMQVTQERYSGYLEVIKSQGCEPLVLTGRSSRSFGHEAAAKLFQEHPDCDAAVCFNDLVAFGMINACHEYKKVIGCDFQIIGFDDVQEAAECWPALSTVRCDVDAFGEQVAETVVAWLEDEVIPKPVRRTPVRLIERQTTRSLHDP
ncbi:MAG: substrate-binding domain-containing protein, partial [Ruegeria sp.]